MARRAQRVLARADPAMQRAKSAAARPGDWAAPFAGERRCAVDGLPGTLRGARCSRAARIYRRLARLYPRRLGNWHGTRGMGGCAENAARGLGVGYIGQSWLNSG